MAGVSTADIRKAMYKSIEMEVPTNANTLAKIESKGYYIFTLTSELDNIVVEIRDGSIMKYISKRSVEGGYIVLSEDFDDNGKCMFWGITGLNLTGAKMYSEIKYGYIAEFFSPYPILEDGTFGYIPAEPGTAEKHDIKEGIWVKGDFYGAGLSITNGLDENDNGLTTITGNNEILRLTSGYDIQVNPGDGSNIYLNGTSILADEYSKNGIQYESATTLTPGKILIEATDSDKGYIELDGIDNEQRFKTSISNGLSGIVPSNRSFKIGTHSTGSWDCNAFRLFSDRGISLGAIDSSGNFKEQLAIGSYDPSELDTINVTSQHICLRRGASPISIDTAIGNNNNIYIANSDDKKILTNFIYKNNILFTSFNTRDEYYSILSAHNRKEKILLDDLENINNSVYAITPYDTISSGKTSFFSISSVRQIAANTEFKVTTEQTASSLASSRYFKNGKARLYFKAIDYSSVDELDELLTNMIDYIADAECSPASSCNKNGDMFSSGNKEIMEKLLASAHTLNIENYYKEMDPDDDGNYIYSVDCDIRSERVELGSQLTTAVDHYITVPISINTKNSYIFVVKEINTINSIINNYFSTTENAAVNYISYKCPMGDTVNAAALYCSKGHYSYCLPDNYDRFKINIPYIPTTINNLSSYYLKTNYLKPTNGTTLYMGAYESNDNEALHNVVIYGKVSIGKTKSATSDKLTIYGKTTIGSTDTTNNSGNMLQVYGKGYFYNSVYSDGVLVRTADYAEYFEWLDSNPKNEDRVGYFVSLNPERKIQISGTNILGIVSATPSVIGNAPQEWPNKYLFDEWGREIIDKTTGLPKLNPEYDETQTYIPRSERREWSPVGMLGMLRVRDDGTCKVGGYCKPNEKGIATAAESGYYITNRYSKDIIEVFLK